MIGEAPNLSCRRIVAIGVCLGLAVGVGGAVLSRASVVQTAAPLRLVSEVPSPLPSAPGSAPVRPAQLHGTVTLAGDAVPEPSEVENTTDPEVCGDVQSRRDLLLSESSRGIRNVIVAVTGIPDHATRAAEPGHLTLANRDCRFEPRAAVATVGSTLETVNHDTVFHSVHLYGAQQENVALPVAGMSRSVRLDSPGMITILCDVHGWMRAYVRVDPHPFHAVTDGDGRFRIPDVPAGSWELEIWHERLGRRSRTVRLDPGSTEEIEITYSLD